MKHPSNRALFAYWDSKRDGAAAPDRSAIEHDALRALLGDVFVLSCDAAAGFPFRVAGTRLCALFGRDLKGESLPALFVADHRRQCEEVIGIVGDEMIAVVAGLTCRRPDGVLAQLELLLLPFAQRPHTPASMTGLLAPLGDRFLGPIGPLRLTSWRAIGRPPRGFAPRQLRKLRVARGLTVYEGIR